MNVHYTRNYGFNLNNKDNTQEIIDFLESRLQNKYQEESKPTRKKIEDLIHLAILIIEPINKGLKLQDVQLIRTIQNRCNILIVIGKCDLLTKQELLMQKLLINSSKMEHQLQVYNFNDNGLELDQEIVSLLTDFQDQQPFGIINGNSDDHKTRVGKISIDIEKYSDMKLIKDTLFCINLAEFRELTNNYIYEGYRTEKLTAE